ncbi:MAG: phospholipid carrier-dependent glycosyltransferase [Synoicihabitans sp.]
MAASVSRNFSTTYDEIAHVTAGYFYWTANDMRFQPENGNFPQRWGALPLLLNQEIKSVPRDHFAWDVGNVWALGETFFYDLGNDPATLLASARAMIALLSGALCWLIFVWSRELFGAVGGLISLALAAFSPTLLAHGGFATSDTAATLCFYLAVTAWWRLLHKLTLLRVMAAGVCVGLLAVAKFSALLFAPIAAAMIVVRMLKPAPLGYGILSRAARLTGFRRLTGLIAGGAVAALIAWTVLWGFYEFRFHPTPNPDERDYLNQWEQVLLEQPPPVRTLADGTPASISEADYSPGIIQSFSRFALHRQLLPEAYINGLLNVDRYSRSRLAYFAGEWGNTGWVTFFPTAFLTKTSLPVLLSFTMSVVLLMRSPRSRRLIYRLTPLWVLAAVYGATILSSNLSIGHRHMLPLYPLIFVLAGLLVSLPKPRWRAGIIGVILAAHVATSFAIRPHYLAYFNAFAGGPENGHKLLVDSSLDWGQDLPGLADWINENENQNPVYLSYFGYGDPRFYGITTTRFGDSYFDRHARTVPASLSGGTYAISATMLRRVYTPVRGAWNPSFEATYAQLQAWVNQFAQHSSEVARVDLQGNPLSQEEVTERLWNYEALQFGRLCHLLEHREPDESIGYSILVYQLTDQEVETALYGSLQELNDLIISSLDP